MGQIRDVIQTQKVEPPKTPELNDLPVGDIVCLLDSHDNVVNLGMVVNSNIPFQKLIYGFIKRSSACDTFVVYDRVKFRYPRPGEKFEIQF